MKNNSVKKLNNKGFSLVELIVAIVILAIIVGPLLKAFVYAARINANSRDNLNANTIATDIAEGIKANSIEYVVGQLGLYSATDFDLMGINASAASEVDASGAAITPSATLVATRDASASPIKPAEYEITSPKDKYYFIIDDIEPMLGKKYDVRITIDATGYKTATGASYDPTTDYNSAALPSFGSIGPTCYMQDFTDDSMLSISGDLFSKAHNNDPSLLPENLDASMLSRTIKFDISKDTSGPAPVNKCKISYDYTLKVSAANTVTATDVVNMEFDVPDGDGVYLFYNPMYQSNSLGNIKDNIDIHNPNNVPMDVYLIRQRLGGYNSFALGALEVNYKTRVRVYEGSSTDPKSATRIKTNINSDISKSGYTELNQGVFLYNGMTITNKADLKEKLGIGEGISGGDSDPYRYSEITIAIYKKDGITNGFLEKDKIHEYTASSLQ